jgi:hypothetical protein
MTEKADKKLEDNKLLHRKGTADVKVEADAAAGMCFVVNGDRTVSSYTYFKVSLVMQANWTTDYIIVFLPVTVTVTLGLEGEVTITGMSIDFAHMDIIWPSVEASLTIKMGLSAGFGCRYASVGVFARLSIGATLHLGEEVYFDALILNGEAGFYAKLDLGLFTLYGEKAWKFLDHKIHLAPVDEVTQTSYISQANGMQCVGEYQGFPVYDIENYEMELANSGVAPEYDWEIPNSTVLTNEVSERAGGKLFELNGKQIALYFVEDSACDPANVKRLVYQVYSDGQWSEPMPVCDNGTSDTAFDAIEYNGQLYLAYSEANKAFRAADYEDDADLIRDVCYAQDISVAKFDPETDSFTVMSRITQDDAYDTMPTLGVSDNALYLVWNKNTARDNTVTFCENRNNNIWHSKLDGAVWSDPVCLIHNCYPVVDLAVLKLNGRMSAAMIVDEDLNLYSTDDRNIYLVKNNGLQSQINCYGTQISQLEAHIIQNQPTLLWKSDDAVMAYAGAIDGAYRLSGENLSIPGEYRFAINTSNISGLFWTASEGEDKTNIYYSFSYDRKEWGAPVVAKTLPYYVTDYSVDIGVFGYSMLFTDTYVQSIASNAEQDLNSYSKLCFYQDSIPKILSVVGHEVMNPGDSSDFTLDITIRNDGLTSIDYMDVLLTEVVYEENTTENASSDEKPLDKRTFQYYFKEIGIHLKPGQTITLRKSQALQSGSSLAQYELSLSIPETPDSESSGLGGGTPSVPTPDIDREFGTSDKVVIYETMRPDFSVAGEYVILGETEYLSVKIANVGEVTGSGYLRIYRLEADENGEKQKILVHSEIIQSLQANHQKFYLLKLEKDFFSETRQEFLCVVECPEDTAVENSCAEFLAYKLAGAEGTQEDVLVQAPVLDSYTQTFDKYTHNDVVVDVTLNEDILGYYGCVDADRNNVDHTVQELDGNVLRLTFNRAELALRDVAHHEFTLYFRTAAGYIQTLFVIKVMDSTPIPLAGEVIILDTESGEQVTGSVERGMTLRVSLSGANTDALQYHWMVDGVKVSMESVYKIAQSDLGKTLNVCVTAAEPYYGTLYSKVFEIEKVERHLSALEIADVTDDGKVLLQTNFQVGDDKVSFGYATVNDPHAVTNWSITPEFSITESGTYYLFTAMFNSQIYQDACSEATVYTYKAPCKHPVYVDGVCTDCGEKDPNYVVINLKYPTLLLEDEIMLNVYFTVEPDMDVDVMGMLTWTAQPEVVDITTAEHVIPGAVYHAPDDQYSVASRPIPAQNLGDMVYFCIYAQCADGSYVYSRQVSYSPADFAYSQLQKASVSDVAKSLYVSILNYGSEAQIYTGYRTDALINRNLTPEMLAYDVEYRSDMVHSISKPSSEKQGDLARTATGFSKRNPTISLESAFAINYYFTPDRIPAGQMQFYYWDASDYLGAEVLSTDNATGQMTMISTAEGYRATLSGISAKDIDAPLYVCGIYSDEEGNTYSTGILPYSIGSFCGNQVNTGSERCKPLAAAIAVYGYCAATYFSVL